MHSYLITILGSRCIVKACRKRWLSLKLILQIPSLSLARTKRRIINYKKKESSLWRKKTLSSSKKIIKSHCFQRRFSSNQSISKPERRVLRNLSWWLEKCIRNWWWEERTTINWKIKWLVCRLDSMIWISKAVSIKNTSKISMFHANNKKLTGRRVKVFLRKYVRSMEVRK